MATDFPKSGDDLEVSLDNSNFDVFPHQYARDLKEDFPEIWDAGGNIRGNEAFELWKRANRGVESESVLDWIREREAWSARHFEDGAQFKDKDLSPNISNIAGVVAQIKWGSVGVLGAVSGTWGMLWWPCAVCLMAASSCSALRPVVSMPRFCAMRTLEGDCSNQGSKSGD